MAKLLFPADGYLFDTHTDVQNTFIEKIHTEGTSSALKWIKVTQKDIDLRAECLSDTEISPPE